MATRTKKSTTAPASNGEHLDSDGFLCLKGALFWKWRAVDAEYRNTEMAYKEKVRVVAEEIQKHPELVKAMAERDAIGVAVKARAKEVQEVYADIEKEYGIKLGEGFSIDDTTGRMYQLDNGQRTPVAPPTPEKPTRKGSTTSRRGAAK
jgi:hypothetical protein